MIARTIKRAFQALGYSVGRYRPTAPGVDAFLDMQRWLSEPPVRVVFDVGANVGDTVARYRALFPDAVVYAFEPFPGSHDRLATRFAGDARVRPQRLAIGDVIGMTTLNVNPAHETNSLLHLDQRADRWQMPAPGEGRDHSIEVPISTLDAFCLQERIEAIDLLKMDIQGAEARALHGAAGLLAARAIRLVYLEINFAPLYEGQASFCDLLDILGRAGYQLSGLYNLVQGDPGLGWGDAIFRLCPP